MTKPTLKNNGTQLNLTAQDVLNIDIQEIRNIENQRILNISRGAR